MKIVCRFPTAQYAFHEVSFDSIEEYKEMMPKFIEIYKEMKKQLKNPTKQTDEPEEYEEQVSTPDDEQMY